MSDIGHNSGVAADRLRAFVQRIERLEDEKSALTLDIADIYKEAKSSGFDVKALRTIIRRRKMDEQKRREQDELVALYEGVFG